MTDSNEEKDEKLTTMRLNVQAEREATTEVREKIQQQRERLHEQRDELATVAYGEDKETEFHRLQDQIQHIQHEILKLQSHSNEDQDEINRLRRLADGHRNDLLRMAEDSQTKIENMQSMQENLQRLREDLQRNHEEDKQNAQKNLD